MWWVGGMPLLLPCKLLSSSHMPCVTRESWCVLGRYTQMGPSSQAQAPSPWCGDLPPLPWVL